MNRIFEVTKRVQTVKMQVWHISIPFDTFPSSGLKLINSAKCCFVRWWQYRLRDKWEEEEAKPAALAYLQVNVEMNLGKGISWEYPMICRSRHSFFIFQ